MQEDSKEKVMDLFQALFMEKAAESLKDLKETCWKKLLSIGLPDRKSEVFQYFPFGKFYESLLQKSEPSSIKEDISSFILPESKGSCFVFLDGIFRKDLSSLENLPKQVIVLSLEEAFKGSYSQFLKYRMQVLLQQEEDSFALLNGALAQDGLFIYVPSKIKVATPVQLLFMQTGAFLPYVGSRVHMFVGVDSELHMINTQESSVAGATFCNHFVDVALEERAIFSISSYTGQANKAFSFTSFRASLKKESVLKSLLTTFGSSSTRHDYRISLVGERAEADLSGLLAAGGVNQAHVNVYMDHSAPFCRSYQFFKNALFAQSKASFTGKIHVRRSAQKTEAYQLNKNLLFSDQATINSKPNLEIFADDVKASHGSTIAQIDEEQLLYLRMRGVSLKEATSLLTIGFCQEILDKIASDTLRKKLTNAYRQFLLEGAEL